MSKLLAFAPRSATHDAAEATPAEINRARRQAALAEIVAKAAADARERPEAYLDDTRVPAGGE